MPSDQDLTVKIKIRIRKPKIHDMIKMKLTLMKWWCVLMHKSKQDNYWNEYSKRFFRCSKCGVHHARRRAV